MMSLYPLEDINMNAGTQNTLRHWLLTLIVAATMAAVTAGVVSNVSTPSQNADPTLWHVDHGQSSGGGGG